MHLVPAPAVRLMKSRVLSRPGVNSVLASLSLSLFLLNIEYLLNGLTKDQKVIPMKTNEHSSFILCIISTLQELIISFYFIVDEHLVQHLVQAWIIIYLTAAIKELKEKQAVSPKV